MSRVGNLPIPVPQGVTITVKGGTVTAKGAKGELTTELPERISAELDGSELVIKRADDERQTRAYHGLGRSLVANMITGVSAGFTRGLTIQGVGYKAEQVGPFVRFDLGYSHPIFYQVPDGIDIAIEKGTSLKVTGIDREVVGRTAAIIRGFRKPEPYKGKGVRYADEQIQRKVGKAGAK